MTAKKIARKKVAVGTVVVSLRTPSKNHYVRINGPKGTRVYVTNLALRELAPLLLQDSVSESLVLLRKSAEPSTKSFSAGRGKKFTVRVTPRSGEIHVQMSKEV